MFLLRDGVRSSVLVLSISVLVGLVPASSALASGPYPDALPDFTEQTPYIRASMSGFSPESGSRATQILVIHEHASDELASDVHTASQLHQQVFGTTNSLVSYFNLNSFGRMSLSPVTESEGVPNDGVVDITSGTRSQIASRSLEDAAAVAVRLADRYVDFSQYDANHDGRVTADELAVVRATSGNGGGGGTRGIAYGVRVDNKDAAFKVAAVTSGTSDLVMIHEVGHIVMGVRDYYGFGIGCVDLHGQCGPDPANVSAYNKMHMRWIHPTVVTHDGYYDIPRADRSPTAFLLYDYARGRDDFFLVENRIRNEHPFSDANNFDRGLPISGLLIMRIDERVINSGDGNIRPLDVMRPDGSSTPNPSCPSEGSCYQGSSLDLWNPEFNPGRTMDRPWRDGTPSRVAVRAVGRSGDNVRAFFDVRGPGVLVDPPLEAQSIGGPIPSERRVVVRLMNTGEAADTFDISLNKLPEGWSAPQNSFRVRMDAGASTNVTFEVDPRSNYGPTDLEEQNYVGASSVNDPSIRSQAAVDVVNMKRPIPGISEESSIVAPILDLEATKPPRPSEEITFPGLPPVAKRDVSDAKVGEAEGGESPAASESQGTALRSTPGESHESSVVSFSWSQRVESRDGTKHRGRLEYHLLPGASSSFKIDLYRCLPRFVCKTYKLIRSFRLDREEAGRALELSSGKYKAELREGSRTHGRVARRLKFSVR